LVQIENSVGLPVLFFESKIKKLVSVNKNMLNPQS